jgi:hypothetical protein
MALLAQSGQEPCRVSARDVLTPRPPAVTLGPYAQPATRYWDVEIVYDGSSRLKLARILLVW